MGKTSAAICLSPAADDLQKTAAADLQRYLKRLFNIEATIAARPVAKATHRFVLGLSSDPFIQKAAGGLPQLSAQGHVVRRASGNTVVLAGGSSAAAAWAVYELVERYGVRYLLHEDVFPAEPGPFHLPEVDATFEPVQKLRSWRQFNDLPTGPPMWSLEQQRSFIRQIFKLKFNGVLLGLWPHQPFIDYEVQGISRKSACMLFGQKIPIDDDTIGREHLPDAPFLNNPEFLGIEGFPDLLAAGKRYAHSLIDFAKRLGMHTTIAIQPMSFPVEFEPLLERPSDRFPLGGVTVSEKGRLTNPNHMALIEATIGAHLEEYGEVDEFTLGVPEHPQADLTYLECWKELAAKYKLEPEFSVEKMIASSQKNYLTPGGVDRSERECKSTITMLHFYDKFFGENDLLQRAEAQGVKIALSIGTGGGEVYPIIDRVLWPGGMIVTNLDYTSSRAVRRIHCMEYLDAKKVPAALSVTLQDDNVGWVPQVATENIHILLQAMHRLGWEGYFTRFWPIGDLDPPAAYMARASWDASVTPRAVYEDHFAHVYGEASVEPFCQVMRMLEDATVVLDLDFLGLLFPVLTIMRENVESDKKMAEGLFHIRAIYEEARLTLERLRKLPGPPARDGNLAYWISRLDFSIHALREIELLHDGGVEVHAAKAAREAGGQKAASKHLKLARDNYGNAIAEGEAALRASASNVRDDSDRSSLAAYYHFLVREVKQMTREFLGSAESSGEGSQ